MDQVHPLAVVTVLLVHAGMAPCDTDCDKSLTTILVSSLKQSSACDNYNITITFCTERIKNVSKIWDSNSNRQTFNCPYSQTHQMS